MEFKHCSLCSSFTDGDEPGCAGCGVSPLDGKTISLDELAGMIQKGETRFPEVHTKHYFAVLRAVALAEVAAKTEAAALPI